MHVGQHRGRGRLQEADCRQRGHAQETQVVHAAQQS